MNEPGSTAGLGELGNGADDVESETAPSASEPLTNAAEETDAAEGAYWRANLRLLFGLITIWFAVSFGCGILFRDFLDQFSLGGYPLGFWFAQQGAIYVFIALIVFYVVRMKQIERKYDLDD